MASEIAERLWAFTNPMRQFYGTKEKLENAIDEIGSIQGLIHLFLGLFGLLSALGSFILYYKLRWVV